MEVVSQPGNLVVRGGPAGISAESAPVDQRHRAHQQSSDKLHHQGDYPPAPPLPLGSKIVHVSVIFGILVNAKYRREPKLPRVDQVEAQFMVLLGLKREVTLFKCYQFSQKS